MPCTRLWVSTLLPGFLTLWQGLCTCVFSGHFLGVRRASVSGSLHTWSLFSNLGAVRGGHSILVLSRRGDYNSKPSEVRAESVLSAVVGSVPGDTSIIGIKRESGCSSAPRPRLVGPPDDSAVAAPRPLPAGLAGGRWLSQGLRACSVAAHGLSPLIQLRILGPGHGEVSLHGAGCLEWSGDPSLQAAGPVGQQHELDRSQDPPGHLGLLRVSVLRPHVLGAPMRKGSALSW